MSRFLAMVAIITAGRFGSKQLIHNRLPDSLTGLSLSLRHFLHVKRRWLLPPQRAAFEMEAKSENARVKKRVSDNSSNATS